MFRRKIERCKIRGKKKNPASYAGPLLYPSGKKAKGEEKPEEELMGKRKSSPRLATTSSN
jgi:hypothetical protein